MQQSQYAASVLLRPDDAARDRELEIRRRRAAAGRRAARHAFSASLRARALVLIGSRRFVHQGAGQRHIAHG